MSCLQRGEFGVFIISFCHMNRVLSHIIASLLILLPQLGWGQLIWHEVAFPVYSKVHIASLKLCWQCASWIYKTLILNSLYKDTAHCLPKSQEAVCTYWLNHSFSAAMSFLTVHHKRT